MVIRSARNLSNASDDVFLCVWICTLSQFKMFINNSPNNDADAAWILGFTVFSSCSSVSFKQGSLLNSWWKSRWCCQLTDLVYDGVFEVLQWLLFLSAVPPVQLLTGWCVTAKAPPDISAISALTAVKHGNCSSLTPLLNPVRTRKSLIWPWMALDAGQQPALWALASTRFYVT